MSERPLAPALGALLREEHCFEVMRETTALAAAIDVLGQRYTCVNAAPLLPDRVACLSL